jgi:hypothetical protein
MASALHKAAAHGDLDEIDRVLALNGEALRHPYKHTISTHLLWEEIALLGKLHTCLPTTQH